MKLLLLMIKVLRLANKLKRNSESVPWSCFCERLISDTEASELQVMPVQLQRLLRLVEDQDSRNEDGDRLFFQCSSASPSSLVARLDGSKRRKNRR